MGKDRSWQSAPEVTSSGRLYYRNGVKMKKYSYSVSQFYNDIRKEWFRVEL